MKGYIKILRENINPEWDYKTRCLYFDLLQKSEAHPDITVNGIKIKRGQLLITYRKLEEETNISRSVLQRMLQEINQYGSIKLEVIRVEKTGKSGTLITIKNSDISKYEENPTQTTPESSSLAIIPYEQYTCLLQYEFSQNCQFRYLVNGIGYEELAAQSLIPDFIAQCQIQETTHENIGRLRTHFLNYLRVRKREDDKNRAAAEINQLKKNKYANLHEQEQQRYEQSQKTIAGIMFGQRSVFDVANGTNTSTVCERYNTVQPQRITTNPKDGCGKTNNG